MDRRDFRCNGSVAHASLKGQVDGVAFVDGQAQSVAVSVADLLVAPNGALDRQLIYGERFCVLDYQDGFAFGFAVPSGFVGYVRQDQLQDQAAPTHRVVTLGAHIYPTRSIKTTPVMALPFGAVIQASDQADGFWRVGDGYIPAQQVQEIDTHEDDTAATALRFLGVPYLWGGDSNWGLDCSGLVHAALRAAGRDCPRDSDQQEAFFAPADGPAQRGDLVFWKGHVGMMVDRDTLVHANGHHMATTLEPLDVVKARIMQSEGKEVTSIRRP